jgi:uncharacterized protein YbaR (Trm112 family)
VIRSKLIRGYRKMKAPKWIIEKAKFILKYWKPIISVIAFLLGATAVTTIKIKTETLLTIFRMYLTTGHSINGFLFLATVTGSTLFIWMKGKQALKDYLKRDPLDKFREGKYENVLCRWEWNNKKIRDIKLLCPECKCELEEKDTTFRNPWRSDNSFRGITLYCDKCKKRLFRIETTNPRDLRDKVKNEMERQAREQELIR